MYNLNFTVFTIKLRLYENKELKILYTTVIKVNFKYLLINTIVYVMINIFIITYKVTYLSCPNTSISSLVNLRLTTVAPCSFQKHISNSPTFLNTSIVF